MKTIRELRQERGWSQHELGVRLGLTGATIYNWERGKYEPTVSTFRKVARVLGVPMNQIAVNDEDRQQADQGGERAAA